MPYRKVIFAQNQFYHVFNRSIGSEQVFSRQDCLKRALDLFNFYRFPQQISFSDLHKLNLEIREMRLKQIYSSPPLVEIVSFALMSDHYHLLLRQLEGDGIKNFISNFQNSYARYYNTKFNRHGSVFTNMFKAVHVSSNEQLIHLARYIHLNPVASYVIEIETLERYPYTSFSTYMGSIPSYKFISTAMLNNYFVSSEKHREFVYNQSDYQRKLKKIRNLMID